MHKVDTTNPQTLFNMWTGKCDPCAMLALKKVEVLKAANTLSTVFARCADSVAEGRRLENLSWRLFSRETFCCEGEERPAIRTPNSSTLSRSFHTSHRFSRAEDVPQLSVSVDSIVDEEAVDAALDSAPVDIVRPRIQRQDSCASSRSRGRERHITSDDLEKMVVSIVQQKGTLAAPPALSKTAPLPRKQIPEAAGLTRSGSTTTESSPAKSSDTHFDSPVPASSPESPSSRTTVVRGFSPSQAPTTERMSDSPVSPPTIPAPEDKPAPMPVLPKQPAKFALGESSSCDESFSDQKHSPQAVKLPVPPQKKKMFTFGGSSEEDSSLRSALHSARANPMLSGQKKQASFSNQISTRTIPTVSVNMDDQSETDYVDESAIDDDDDSSDWEDSNEESGKSSVDEKTLFQRVDSKANLTSRRSLITLMLAQNDRSQKLGNPASQSTSALARARVSPNGPSIVASPNDSDDGPLMMKTPRSTLRPIHEVPRSSAQPIMTTTNHLLPPAALSPKTTRRNMLATEMTESLRRHLLWERQQKTQTANAVLKRRHTSQDVANLKQYPEKPFINRKADDINASSWDQFVAKETHNGYHSKGW
jgi:hypothetical protein